MKIGFTGTRKGMTQEQRDKVHDLLVKLQPKASVHGDCIGADADFDGLCEGIGLNNVQRTCRPCIFKSARAYTSAMVVAAEKHPMARNRDIVADADVMIACPPNFTRIKSGSGTWATIGFAQRAEKPLWIVFPDGTVEAHNTLVEVEKQ